MSTGRRLSIMRGGILAGYAIALLMTSPILAAAEAGNSPTYKLNENASTPQLLAEKPGKGNAGEKGKGGENDAGGNTGNDNATTGDDQSAGDTDGQDIGAPATGNVSNDSSQEIIEAQQISPEDMELAGSYPEDTFPESYFLDKPMKKLQLQRYLVLNEEYRVVSSVRAGDGVEVVLGFKNIQQKEQICMLITQVVDQDGITQDVGWSVDVVESGGYVDWFKLWRPGICTIKVMVWDGIGENPVPLSELNAMTIIVQNASP